MSQTMNLPGEAKKKSPLLWMIGIVAVLLIVSVIVSRIATDYWWFASVDFQTVFTTRLVTQVVLFAAFTLIMGGALYASLAIAYRLRPKVRRANLDSEFLVQARDVLDAKSRTLMVLPSAIIGIMAGMSASAMTDTFLASWRGVNFGVIDPYYGMDASFYVFHLPWWRFVVGFVLTVFIVSGIGAMIVHFMTGSLTVKALTRAGNVKDSIGAHRHLSIMLGLTMLVLAVNTFLGRFSFLTSPNSQFSAGVNYTDASARMPAQTILAGIILLVALVAFFNAWKVRWAVPGVAVALLIVSSLLITGPYPWLIQQYQVLPNEQDRERPFITKHVEATRAAFDIENVDINDYEATTEASAGQLRADAEALPAIRLIDPAVVPRTFEQLQQVRGYYRFPQTLDVDRYVIDGQHTDAVVAVRELDFEATDAEVSWNNQRTVYTHGYGMVAAFGNQRHVNGEPVFFSGGIPTVGLLPEHEPRIYFGERTTDYVVVGAPEGREPVELDTPSGGEGRTESRYTYTGAGGVPVGNLLNRLAFAVRFGDINLMLSDRVHPESKLLHNRVPLQRVAEVAPWLTLDSDPYPSVVDGKIVWIIDAYTTSAEYPNSQRLDYTQATSDSRTRTGMLATAGREVNYIRNSVKATVDAYDGTVKLYEWDKEDPILQTWQRVYPGTITPKEEIPESLIEHLRYPQDLFKVQREILGRYHTRSADTWYQQSDIWQVPNDPVRGGDSQRKEPPYFLTIRWPGDDRPHYANTTIFVPKDRENLSVYMSANADATSPNYGQLRVLKLSDEKQIPGPGQTYNAIRTNETVADRLLPFNREGSDTTAIFGNLLTLPLGGGLLYVQPIYTVTSTTTGGYPALRFVVVRFGERVGIGDTLQAALDQVFEGDAGAETGERIDDAPEDVPQSQDEDGNEKPSDEQSGSVGTEPPSSPSPTPGETPTATTAPDPGTQEGRVRAILDEAQEMFKEADAALREGDLAKYQERTKAAQQRIVDALEELDG